MAICRNRRQNSSFSNKQSKRILSRSNEEISRKLEDIRRYEQACIDAIERITRVACKMQCQLANTFCSEMRTSSLDEVINQSGSERNNVQLTEIVNIHSTDETVDIAAAQEMPARPVNPVSSARSARLRHTPFTSAPAQYQLMPRAVSKSEFDSSSLESCDTCVD